MSPWRSKHKDGRKFKTVLIILFSFSLFLVPIVSAIYFDPFEGGEGVPEGCWFTFISPVDFENYTSPVIVEMNVAIPEEMLEDPEFVFFGIDFVVFNVSDIFDEAPVPVRDYDHYFDEPILIELPVGDYVILASDGVTGFVGLFFSVIEEPEAIPSPTPYSDGFSSTPTPIVTPTPTPVQETTPTLFRLTDEQLLLVIVAGSVFVWFVFFKKKKKKRKKS